MPLRTPLSSLWIRGFITWLTYTLTGLLAVSLASPQDFVSPLYLAAGLGLALVIGWGPWMILAVGLGSATVNFVSQHPSITQVSYGTALTMALIGSLGAGLQAWVALRLTRLADGRPLALDTPTEIGRFLLLAGPLACLVSASVSVSGLAVLGLLPLAELPQAFAGWWAGDTMGVLVGTPMMLTLVGHPAALWRARREQVGLPLLVATVLLTLAVRQLHVWRADSEAAVFTSDVAAATNEVKLRLNGYTDALIAISGVFEASDQVTRAEFSRASRHWVASLKGIQAVGWDERLRAADLPAFEARQRAEGLGQYKVFDTESRQPPRGDELVVVRYVEPLNGNEMALGYNLLSNPASRQAFEDARREGRAMSTKGFKLMQEPGQQTGVVVYQPVFKGQAFTPQMRIQANVGAVFLALRMDDAVAAMLQGRPAYLEACLQDGSEAGQPVLGGSPACHAGHTGRHSPHRQVVPVEFAGRKWQLVMWSEGPVPMGGQGLTTWILAVGGVAFSAALGALLLVMTGHARRTEEAMQEASLQRRAAEQANQAKSDFLSRMSHELRTPLNAVLGFAQVMELDQRDPLPPTQRQRVEQIQQAGWHLLDMIDDVLDISRIDSGTLRLHAEPLRVCDELGAAIKLVQAEADRQGVTVNMPGQLPAEWGVTADASRLRQILANLLSNAIKFNRRGGSVNIKVTQSALPGQPPTLHLSVQDTGLGMSSHQLTQLFQPFNRLGREQGPTDGTGIGLVISRHLALLMGGQLEVQSTEGQGSSFTLSLPALLLPPTGRAPAPAPPSAPLSERPMGGTPRPRHVLYVEDNLANSEVIRAALSARPWVTVSVAPTTEEGLAVLHNRLRGSKPDLILLDVHLPDASGQDLLKLIKANPDTANIPVIMISADAMPEQIDAALSAGAACYLTKPVQLAELLRQVDELMPA